MSGLKPPGGRRRRALRLVVSAGPTREHIDPVRYISNESSGRQGFAIAAAAARSGMRVTLIAGPVQLETPPRVERIDVVSAREMLAAVKSAFPQADALVMAAAVGDWRPARRLTGKWRKKDDGEGTASLELVRNPDILATVAAKKGDRLVIGFALETADGIRRARRKMRVKGTDYIVLNDESALNAIETSVTILGCDDSCLHIENCTKDTVADAIVDIIAARFAKR